MSTSAPRRRRTARLSLALAPVALTLAIAAAGGQQAALARCNGDSMGHPNAIAASGDSLCAQRVQVASYSQGGLIT